MYEAAAFLIAGKKKLIIFQHEVLAAVARGTHVILCLYIYFPPFGKLIYFHRRP